MYVPAPTSCDPAPEPTPLSHEYDDPDDPEEAITLPKSPKHNASEAVAITDGDGLIVIGKVISLSQPLTLTL